MQHSRPVTRYQTDLTDAEWRVIAPHLPKPCATGRPREWPMREIVNGIFYVMRAGCPWRLLPNDLPPWGTIYRWFAAWRDGNRDFVRMRWGLVPSWWPKPLKELKAATFNARAETVADKPFFRDAFRRTRCLIPASGYYEWQNTATGKQPWYFTRADGEPMTFAGLWDEWKDKATGEVLKSCTMLITEPNDFVAEVHDRMPVVLESKDFASWLNDGGLNVAQTRGKRRAATLAGVEARQ